LIFPTNFFSEIFLFVRRIQWDFTITVHNSACKVFVILVRFRRNVKMFWKIFEKFSNIKKSVQWETSCSMLTGGRKDRHNGTNNRFSKFVERARKRAEYIKDFYQHSSSICSNLTSFNSDIFVSLPFYQEWSKTAVSFLPVHYSPSLYFIICRHLNSHFLPCDTDAPTSVAFVPFRELSAAPQ